MTLYISLAIVLIQMSITGESCTCVPEHHQRSYCNADYVVQATVVSDRMEEAFAAYYKINISTIYKGQDEIKRIQQNMIVSNHTCTNNGSGDACIKTRRTSAECGLPLDVGNEYLFVGWIEDDMLSYGLCSAGGNLKYVDIQAIDNIKKGYDCGCSVVSCIGDYCYNDNESMNDDLKCKNDAYVWASYHCTCDKVDGKCVWSEQYC